MLTNSSSTYVIASCRSSLCAPLSLSTPLCIVDDNLMPIYQDNCVAHFQSRWFPARLHLQCLAPLFVSVRPSTSGQHRQPLALSMERVRRPGTSDDKEVISSLLSTSGPPNFLFVNETSDAPPYKLGNRSDVRSHVRKYSSKQFKETHKTAQKRTKAEIGQRTRNNVLAPRSLSHNLLKTLPQGRSYLSNASATSGQSSIRRHGTLDPEIPNVNDSGKEHVWYCSRCEEQREVGYGRHYHESKVEEASTAICRHLWRTLQPSPVSILGAGTRDPFACLPIGNPTEKDHESIDHGKHDISPKN